MSEYLTLNKSNCKNCYKCIRNCPVKSIKFSGGQAHIVGDECVLCGRCYVVCPQNAKRIKDETEAVNVLLKSGAPVIASVAPSFIAYFDSLSFSAVKAALLSLGFSDAQETAVGATQVKREYERLAADGLQDIIITSCCHTVNQLARKYYSDIAQYLAPVVTPMCAHAREIKRSVSDAKVVFIGPCLSKKDEAAQSDVDAVITFDELSMMLSAKGITPEETTPEDNTDTKARLFPTTGGILKTMTEFNPEYTYMTVDGMDNCKAVLEDIANGNIHRCFIEMSACSGSCIGGPIMERYRNYPVRHYRAVANAAGDGDFPVGQPQRTLMVCTYLPARLDKPVPDEKEMTQVLHMMGKYKPEDELNCGTCGYNTCREKAAAVCQGKAEISMCLPFLMEKSERFSFNILNNSPNGILVVNDDLEVQQINPAAMKMLNVRRQSDVLGEPVVRILDPYIFIDVLENSAQIHDRRDYFAEYDKFLEQTVVHDKASKSLILILRDVTDEEHERRKREQLVSQTAQTADKVVEKQMRIVQEIASLLGETAAETKIALTKLKESVPHDTDE